MSSATMARAKSGSTELPLHTVRVVLDNPPPQPYGSGNSFCQLRDIVTELENDERMKVVVLRKRPSTGFLSESLGTFPREPFEDLASIPQGPTGLEAWA